MLLNHLVSGWLGRGRQGMEPVTWRAPCPEAGDRSQHLAGCRGRTPAGAVVAAGQTRCLSPADLLSRTSQGQGVERFPTVEAASKVAAGSQWAVCMAQGPALGVGASGVGPRGRRWLSLLCALHTGRACLRGVRAPRSISAPPGLRDLDQLGDGGERRGGWRNLRAHVLSSCQWPRHTVVTRRLKRRDQPRSDVSGYTPCEGQGHRLRLRGTSCGWPLHKVLVLGPVAL